MNKPLWQTVRQKPVMTQREFRGINKLDPFAIHEGYATDSKNLVSTRYPAITVRPGYYSLGRIGTRCLGLGLWKDTELHGVFNDGTWRKWDGSAWVTLASGLDANAAWTFTNFKGNLADVNLIGSNGIDPIKRYDGTSVQNLTGAPASGNYITQYADRLWCAVGNELKASSYRMADDWTTVNDDDADSWYTIVETPNGETINGIHSGLSKLTITKPSSIHELYGYAPSDYDVRVVTLTNGVVNNRSAAAIDGLLYFMDKNGFYAYGGGMSPDKQFSALVQPYADTANQLYSNLSVAGTDGQRVYFSFAEGGATTQDTLLVYDKVFQSWNVWKNMYASHMVMLGGKLVIGDINGNVIVMDGTTDAGTPVSWHWVSKPFSGASLAQTIRWMAMWITLDLPTGSTVNVYLSKSDSGDSDWELVGSVSALSDIQRKPINISSGKVTNARYIRMKLEGTGSCTVYEISREEHHLPLV